MKNNNCSKIVKAKKASLKTFLTGLAGVVALTSVISLSGCSFNTSTNNPNSGYEIEIETEHEHNHEHNHEHEHEEVEEPEVETPEVEEPVIEDTEVETPVEETEEVETSEVIDNYDYESVVIRNYDGISIVEALRLNGYDYSFKFRKALAAYHGIENYRGTAEQNIQLLNILRNKGLDVTPDAPVVPETPVQPSIPTPPTPPTPGPENPEHEHSWSDWRSLNDQKEVRTCSCGARQTRNHSYGAWSSNGNDTESRTCNTCGHTQTRDVEHTHDWSDWSAFDDSQEVRSCSCGEKDYRSHSYGAWSNNGNNTESRTCGTCGHTQTRDIAHTHAWGAWEYLNDSLEQRECSCGQTETREHSLGTPSVEYQNNNDGTHTIITTKHCSTCNHDITTERTASCDLGEWTYNSTTRLDERVCSYCGYTETREHIHTDAPDNLVYGNATSNDDGTHRLTATYTCTSCNQTVTLTKDENCDFGAWLDHGTYHSRSCTECGYTEQNVHYPDSNGVQVTASDREDHHIESYVCGDCGITISTEVACTSDNTVHYEEINGVTVEYSNCTECGQKCDERSHTHNYGDWSYLDENNEVRSCGCGYGTETRSHNYGEWTYDPTSGQLVQTCSGCGHTKTKAHTHSYGTPVREESNDSNVCYVEVSTCECGDEVRTPIDHVLEETTMFGKTYIECLYCDYEEVITNTASQTFGLERPTITEEQYDEIVNEVLNEITEEEIIEEEIIEDEIIEDEIIEDEVVEEEIEEEQLPDKTVEEVIEEDVYKEEEGEKDLENNEEDTKSLSLIP